MEKVTIVSLLQYKKPYITPKQQRVIDCFDGDYINTAKNAGVTHSYVKRLCTDGKYKHIQKAIRHRNNKRSSKIGKIIASRENRQAFWTSVLMGKELDRGEPPKMSDRLKASELLGRSEADFTENITHGGVIGLKKLLDDIDGNGLGPTCQKD